MMRDDLPGGSPTIVWLRQRTEAPIMTLKLIQQRSRSY